MIEWHHLLGVGLTDYLTGSCYEVVMEKELSLKKQRLDILIIEQKEGQAILELPDGLSPFARHNLITYKSLRQSLDAWALNELISHYVNYRKQISPSLENLLPDEDFRLYAICTRRPEKLEAEYTLQSVQEGVYDLHWGGRLVRIIVLSEIPQSEHNALWLLFSGVAERVRFGRAHYEPRQPELSPVLNKLLVAYNLEGIAMPYTVEDFKREVKREYLAMLTPEELSEIVRPEEIINRLPAEDRLKGLPAEERLRGLPAEERLKGLTKKQIEAYLKKLSAQSRGRKRKA